MPRILQINNLLHDCPKLPYFNEHPRIGYRERDSRSHSLASSIFTSGSVLTDLAYSFANSNSSLSTMIAKSMWGKRPGTLDLFYFMDHALPRQRQDLAPNSSPAPSVNTEPLATPPSNRPYASSMAQYSPAQSSILQSPYATSPQADV